MVDFLGLIEDTPVSIPTGDVVITPDMIPCEVHVLLDGTVTLSPKVDQRKVSVFWHNRAVGKVVVATTPTVIVD